MATQKVDVSEEAKRLRRTLRRENLHQYVALILLAQTGYADKRLRAVLQRLQPADASLDSRITAALGDIAVDFEEPRTRT